MMNYLREQINRLFERFERKTSGEKNLLYQRYGGDCQITCIGMILGWEYKQVAKAFERRLETILRSKMKCADIIKFLRKNLRHSVF